MGQGLWSKVSGAFSNGEAATSEAEESAERKHGKTSDNFRFAVYVLSSVDDGKRAADAMKSGNGVVINGEGLDELTYQRALDFLDGAAHVLGVSSRSVSGNVQVYSPPGMDVVDEIGSYYGNLTPGKKRFDV
jgi:FtsZ-interacting cell division protein YlmF